MAKKNQHLRDIFGVIDEFEEGGPFSSSFHFF
jgi:hypothetical protein